MTKSRPSRPPQRSPTGTGPADTPGDPRTAATDTLSGPSEQFHRTDPVASAATRPDPRKAATMSQNAALMVPELARPAIGMPRRERAGAPPATKRLYRVTEAMAVLSLSRSVIYEQFRRGRLRSVKEGNTRLVPDSAIADYVALLEHEAEASDYGMAS